MTTKTTNQVTEMINKLTVYGNLNEAWKNSNGDLIFIINGGFFVCSEHDEISEILIESDLFKYENGAFIKK